MDGFTMSLTIVLVAVVIGTGVGLFAILHSIARARRDESERQERSAKRLKQWRTFPLSDRTD